MKTPSNFTKQYVVMWISAGGWPRMTHFDKLKEAEEQFTWLQTLKIKPSLMVTLK